MFLLEGEKENCKTPRKRRLGRVLAIGVFQEALVLKGKRGKLLEKCEGKT